MVYTISQRYCVSKDYESIVLLRPGTLDSCSMKRKIV